MNAYIRYVIARRDQALFDSERPDTREYVAAVLCIAYERLVDAYLQKIIVDVRIVALRSVDNRHFTRQGMGTAEAVYLARIGRTHGGQQNPIA